MRVTTEDNHTYLILDTFEALNMIGELADQIRWKTTKLGRSEHTLPDGRQFALIVAEEQE
tara:strand:+ start:305 stop:484 length:180 start_codon:yes stop_codon:yes gene_type:complete